jgi:hypothetical protein
MTLEWSPRPLIDVNDDSIWIAWKINSNVNVNLGHLLVYLRLDITYESTKTNVYNPQTFFSGFVFLTNGLSFPEIEVTS